MVIAFRASDTGSAFIYGKLYIHVVGRSLIWISDSAATHMRQIAQSCGAPRSDRATTYAKGSSMNTDPYAALGLTRTATTEEIKKARNCPACWVEEYG